MTISRASVPASAAIADPQIPAALHDRATKGQDPTRIAARDLARYYRLLGEQLATIELSQAEAMLVWHGLMAARSERERVPPSRFPSLVAAVASETRRQEGMTDLRDRPRQSSGYT